MSPINAYSSNCINENKSKREPQSNALPHLLHILRPRESSRGSGAPPPPTLCDCLLEPGWRLKPAAPNAPGLGLALPPTTQLPPSTSQKCPRVQGELWPAKQREVRKGSCCAGLGGQCTTCSGPARAPSSWCGAPSPLGSSSMEDFLPSHPCGLPGRIQGRDHALLLHTGHPRLRGVKRAAGGRQGVKDGTGPGTPRHYSSSLSTTQRCQSTEGCVPWESDLVQPEVEIL